MKPLLVLAGGFGTRLRSIVNEVPKPLAPVNGSPFLKYLIKNWLRQGVREFIFLLHFEAEKIELMISEMQNSGELEDSKIHIIVEQEPLGTGGSVANAINLLGLDGGFLVANADTWLDHGITDLDKLGANSIAAVLVPDCKRYGSVSILDNKVVQFREKQTESVAGWINAGLYCLDAKIFSAMSSVKAFSLEDSILPWCIENSELKVFTMEAQFVDIGVPSDYLRFCELTSKGNLRE